MALSLERRAARLVAALKDQGIHVASLVIAGGEIKVTFVGTDQPELDAYDLVDFRRDLKAKTQLL